MLIALYSNFRMLIATYIRTPAKLYFMIASAGMMITMHFDELEQKRAKNPDFPKRDIFRFLYFTILGFEIAYIDLYIIG